MNVLRGAGGRDVLGPPAGVPMSVRRGGVRGAGPGGGVPINARRGRDLEVREPMNVLRGAVVGACVGRGPAAYAPMSARRVRGGRCASRGGGVGGGSGNSLQKEGSREGRRPGRSALRASRARLPPPPRLSKAGGPRSGAKGPPRCQPRAGDRGPGGSRFGP